MKKINLLLVAMSMALTFSSCKKEGCTDTNAINYSEDTKDDDNSCTYEGNLVLWWDEQTATELNDVGVNSVSFFVEGNLIGAIATTIYHIEAPSCGDNGALSYTRNLKTAKNETFAIKAVTDSGIEETFLVSVQANSCNSLEVE